VANYQTIARLRPEVREFIRNRRWVQRGEAVTYGADIHCSGFSTDEGGFRHSVFEGETLSVSDCVARPRYGVVLGSSHLYGFGLAGNQNTIPSLLAERFGFPFANVSIPEANSRNLFSLLNAIFARASQPPVIVVLMSGGDFTSFCFTGIADPVFGSANLKQVEAVLKERRAAPSAEAQLPSLLSFTSLWTRMIVERCDGEGVSILLGSDSTFFEKAQPSELERQCGLGVAFNRPQEKQFARQKALFGQFCARRQGIAEALNVALAGPGATNDLTFIDEFHYDREGTGRLADDYAAAIEGML
jgi:hypothetical protein